MKSGAGEDPWEDDVEDDQDDVDDQEAEEIVEHEQVGDLVVQEDETEESEDSMVDIMAESFAALDEGEMNPNISFRHERLKALLASVEDSPELREELAALGDAVGEEYEADDLDQSTVARAALAAGLQTAVPEVLEALQEAEDQHRGNSIL